MDINCLWSKGINPRNSYMVAGTESIGSVDTIRRELCNPRQCLWIRNTSKTAQVRTDLDILADIIDCITDPKILITTDGDRPVPSSYCEKTVRILLDSDKILLWYTQNYDGTISHPKLKPFPIGLDLHSKRWMVNNSALAKLNYYDELRKREQPYITDRIFCDAHLSITHPERRSMFQTLKANAHIDFLGSIQPFLEICSQYRKYKFVLSPRGNGLDCHRTWELFLLGCIPIIKSSSLDIMWKTHGLPVVIISDWAELNDNNIQAKLDQWNNDLNPYTDYHYIRNKMSYQYWIGS